MKQPDVSDINDIIERLGEIRDWFNATPPDPASVPAIRLLEAFNSTPLQWDFTALKPRLVATALFTDETQHNSGAVHTVTLKQDTTINETMEDFLRRLALAVESWKSAGIVDSLKPVIFKTLEIHTEYTPPKEM